MFIDQSIDRIRSFRRARGWSIFRLANEAGMHESTIRRMDDPSWSPNAETLRRLEGLIPSDFEPTEAAE